MVVSMKVQAALQEFLVQLEADGRSPHTIGQYRRHGRALFDWLERTENSTAVADLTPGVIAGFFADTATRASARGGTKKATSLNAMRTSIRCFAGYLRDTGRTAENPGRLLRRARCAPPPPRALHDDEQQRLLEVLRAATGTEGERDRMLVTLLLRTGIRIGSAIALDVEDVDFGHGELTLRTTKNSRPITIVLPDAVGTELKGFLGGRTTGPVFTARGSRMSIRHAQRRISTWLEKAGISGRSAHSLRHTLAMRIYSATGDLQITQAALGHSSVVSTTIYARVDRQRLRRAMQG